MKIKLKRGGVVRLGVEAGPEEELIYAEAECVRAGCAATLLTFDYQKKKKGYEFQYHVGTARPLSELLARPLSNDYFEAMLVSFLHLAQACEREDLSTQRIVFDPEFIFFDPARYVLKFVYLPFRSKGERPLDPLHALEHITGTARFEHSFTRGNAERMLDYVRRCTLSLGLTMNRCSES